MTSKQVFAVIIMIWFTLLTVWVVSNLKTAPNNGVLTLQGIPGPSVQSQKSVIQIDKETVWIIDPDSNYISVIKHDQDGYQMTQTQMPIKQE